MSKLKLLQLQLALFFQDIENRPDRFIKQITEVSGSVFDQMPTILPIPPNAPPEIPVVILNSGDHTCTCNISKSRIDFIINFQNSNNEDISKQLESFLDKIRPYASVIFGYKNIIRFGFIGQYFFKTDTSVETLQSKYFKNNLGTLEELNIRYNKRFSGNNLIINNVVELGKGTFVGNQGIQQEGILIQRDINNVPNSSLIPIEDVFSIIKSKLPSLGPVGMMEILE